MLLLRRRWGKPSRAGTHNGEFGLAAGRPSASNLPMIRGPGLHATKLAGAMVLLALTTVAGVFYGAAVAVEPAPAADAAAVRPAKKEKVRKLSLTLRRPSYTIRQDFTGKEQFHGESKASPADGR